jgi:phosphate transport system protein|tara:strand:+ start:197 stop:865 length:669 start_codon:yes stop_codon:yes gene_type:complete
MTDDTHIVKSYGEELQFLNDSIIQMGSLTESLLADSMNAITILDKDAVERIVQSDKKINEYRAKIDTQIMTLLVKRAPMAIDLRITITALRISQDLERIGDLAKGNAKKMLPLPLDLSQDLLKSLKRLGSTVENQLNKSLDAYIKKSKEAAIEVIGLDEGVNNLAYLAIKEILAFLSKDAKNIEFATNLLFVAKNLERAGDHIRRISENIYYLVEGDYYKKP